MDRIRIMIVSEDRSASMGISAMLEKLGHVLVACASTVQEAMVRAAKLTPDLVIMDCTVDNGGGLKASRMMLEQRALPLVLLAGCIDPALIDQADAIGVAGYLLKPVSEKDIQPALLLAQCRFRQLRSLKQEIADLKNRMRARKLIEQAKGLLMARERISEAEAFKRIQSMSRNQNIPMAALSESIILADKVMQNKRANRDRSWEFRELRQDHSQD